MSFSVLNLGNSTQSPSKRKVATKRSASQTTPYSFICAVCGVGFTRSAALKEHKLSHTGEQPHSCGTCGTKFRRRNDKARHEATAHKEKEHICKGILRDGQNWGCGARFSRADALKEHWRRRVGRTCRKLYLEEQDSISDVYRCHLCERICKGESVMVAHLEGHLQDYADLPFRCDCGIAFADAGMQKRHASRFLQPACGADLPGCGLKFDTHAELALHLNGAYGDKGKSGTNGAGCMRMLRRVEKENEEELKRVIGHPERLKIQNALTSTDLVDGIHTIPATISNSVFDIYETVADSVRASRAWLNLFPQLNWFLKSHGNHDKGDSDIVAIVNEWRSIRGKQEYILLNADEKNLIQHLQITRHTHNHSWS